ncbi:MAG: carbohydrate ABC transporter permease [Chloroflexota bacterium]|nr:MAG: carbohydrate ABC transporter permease [Chloroflexota bacterium]
MKRPTPQKIISTSLRYLIVTLGAVIMLVPFVWMVSTAFKEYAYVIEFPPRLIPEHPSVQNFIDSWTTSNFQLYFKNSMLVGLSSLVLSVLISSLTAYAFARFEFPGKEVLFYLILLVLMVPNLISIIPQFFLAKAFNLRNSLVGLVLFYVAGSIPLNTFLLRGFFESLPKELEEAMLIDGGNFFTIFIRMVLPLSKPALATVSIFSMLGFWDEYVQALTFIDLPAKRTLPIAIASFQAQHGTDWGLVFAAALIAVIPVILIYISMQRYFTSGLTTGAFKG